MARSIINNKRKYIYVLQFVKFGSVENQFLNFQTNFNKFFINFMFLIFLILGEYFRDKQRREQEQQEQQEW